MKSIHGNTEFVKLISTIMLGQPSGGEDYPLWFQTAHDGKRKGRDADFNPKLSRSLYGTYRQLEPELRRLEKQGAAVWWLAADCNDQVRAIETVSRLPCLRVEIDGELPILDLHPTAIVKTPNGYHLYWKVDGLTTENYPPLVRGVIKALGADKRAKDTVRVLRAVGFAHQKSGRQDVSLLELSGYSYDYDTFQCVYPPEHDPVPVSSSPVPVSSSPVPVSGGLAEKIAYLESGGAYLRDGKDDRSGGDMAYINLLGIAGLDAAEIDRRFRMSARMRPKWDTKHYANGDTYGQRIIQHALKTLKTNKPNRTDSTAQDIVAKYLEQKDYALSLIQNRETHYKTREMYVKLFYGIFDVLGSSIYPKTIEGGRLHLNIKWDWFCDQYCLDKYKATQVRRYLEQTIGLMCVNGRMSLPINSPREWLQQLATFEIKGYNAIKGYTPPKHPKTSTRGCKTPVEHTASQRITKGCDIGGVLAQQRGARLYRKGYHASRYANYYRSLRRKSLKSPQQRAWLEREAAYHLLAFQTLAMN